MRPFDATYRGDTNYLQLQVYLVAFGLLLIAGRMMLVMTFESVEQRFGL
jgi:hypothetical protein